MLEPTKSIVSLIQTKTNLQPEWCIILGSGLGQLAQEIEIDCKIPYSEIDALPNSTVAGHAGNLILGKLGSKSVIVFQGRFHFYEGYSMKEVALPIYIAHQLGVKKLAVSNASGGTNPNFEIGDLMLINDHISLLLPTNPLIGKNDSSVGPRFPDMSEAYNSEMIATALAIGKENSIQLHQGVYVGVTGPTFETPAEYKMIALLGGDAVGMSTVPEVMAAKHCGMDVFGISVITDLGVEGKIVEVSHQDVQKAANAAAEKMTTIVKALIEKQ